MARYVIVKNGLIENIINWDGKSSFDPGEGAELHQHDTAHLGALWPYVEPEPEAVDPEIAIKSQIYELESQVTNRRLREAALTEEGKEWLEGINQQITSLRQQL